jgi:hypothetical protein
VAGLVFGQTVGQEMFSLVVGLAGIGLWLGFLVFALAIKGGSR